MRIEQELVQPGRLNLFPLAHQRWRQPSPGIIRLDVRIHRLLVGNHHRKQEPGKVTTPRGIVATGIDRILRHDQVLASDRPRFAINKRVMPEREGTVDDRLRVSLLDRNTILIDKLRLARLRVEHRHAHERRLPPALAVGGQRRRHLLRGEVRRQEGIIRKGTPFTERLWLVMNIPAVHPHRVATTAVVLLRHHEAVESRLLAG